MSQAEERTVRKDGYELTFYPGFASRATVRGRDGEIELYRQDRPYHLPDGEKKPKSKYRITLKGGKKKQDVTLRVEDPTLRIKSIVVELYEEDRDEEATRTSEDAETFTVSNDAVHCPPVCEPT